MAASFAREALRVRPHGALFTHVSLLPLMRFLRVASPRTRAGLLGHGVEVWKPLSRIARASLRQVDSVIAPSRFTAEQLIAINGVERHKVCVIPHSLPPDWNAPPIIEPRPTGAAPQLLAVARLTPADVYKGVGQIVAAMPAVVRAHPQVKLSIAGDGSDRPRLEELARSLRMRASIEFVGEVSEPRLRELYAQSDLFVLPSQKEGFGLVFLEAMFHGVPVIAARAGGAVDVVEHGGTGMLVGGDDSAELSAAICQLMDDPARRLRLARAAQARVLSDFMFANFSKHWSRWLAQLCPGPVYGALQSAFVGAADQPSMLVHA